MLSVKLSVEEFKSLYPFLSTGNADYIYVIDNTYYLDESCCLKHLSGLELPDQVVDMKLPSIVRELCKKYKFLPLCEEMYLDNRYIISDQYLDNYYSISTMEYNAIELVSSISDSVHEYVNALFFMGYISYCSPLHMDVAEKYTSSLNSPTKHNYAKMYKKFGTLKPLEYAVKNFDKDVVLSTIKDIKPKDVAALVTNKSITPQDAISYLCFVDYSVLKGVVESNTELIVIHKPELEELEAIGFTNVFLHSNDNLDHPDKKLLPENRPVRNNALIHFTPYEKYPLHRFKKDMNVQFHKEMNDKDYMDSVNRIIRPVDKTQVPSNKPYTLTHHHSQSLLKNNKVVNEILSNPNYTKVDLMSIFGIAGAYL